MMRVGRPYADAYRKALEEFARADPAMMAACCGGSYRRERGVLELSYCGAPVRASHPSGEVECDTLELTGAEVVLVLQYLAGARGFPPVGRWVSFLELPGGPHHYDLFRREAVERIARRFGDRPEELVERAGRLGGTPARTGSASASIPAFHGIPLLAVVWGGDEEFPPSANLVFDAGSHRALPTASLYVLGIEVSKRLCGEGGP